MTKCVCGYKKGFDLGNDAEYFCGDEEFIRLDVVVMRKDLESWANPVVKLIACPKCGTVKVEGIEKE